MNRSRKGEVLFLLALIALVSLAARQRHADQPHQWEESWREPLLFTTHSCGPGYTLRIEEDRFRLETWSPNELNRPPVRVSSGTIALENDCLTLLSDSPPRRFRRAGEPGRWILAQATPSDGDKLLLRQDPPDVQFPLALPLAPGSNLSIGGIQPGMTREEVGRVPEAPELVQPVGRLTFGKNASDRVVVEFSESGEVTEVEGLQLEVDGNPILNARSNLQNVDDLNPVDRVLIIEGTGPEEVYQDVLPAGPVEAVVDSTDYGPEFCPSHQDVPVTRILLRRARR